MGKILIILGIGISIIGGILYLFPNALNWLGNLPGDIKIEREQVNVYIPITTMVLLSILISILLRLLR